MKSRRILAVLLILCLGTGLVHAATTITFLPSPTKLGALILATAPPFPSASKPTTASLSSFQETRMGRRTTLVG